MRLFLFAFALMSTPLWAADSTEPAAKPVEVMEPAKTEVVKQPPAILTPPSAQPRNLGPQKRTKKSVSETSSSLSNTSAVSDAATSAPPSAPGDMFSSLDYPELQVVPRATERLQMESQIESDRGWMAFWPFTLSAAVTFYSGYKLNGAYSVGDSADQKKQLDYFSQAAEMVGIAWIGLTTYYSFTKPYASENKKIRGLGGRDRRGELLRERLAEEALERPARMVQIFTWASVVTNFFGNAILFGQSTPANNIYPIAGMIASTLPWIFNNRYIENYEKHLEYKRKIYAPIAYVDFYRSSLTARLEPKMVLQWNF